MTVQEETLILSFRIQFRWHTSDF